ncbi:hypothetical protein [Lactiplantibacillus argentoratensis]|uniref:hypothetical protein n=1 Tax=Lactiplantibacillus argentoratensis TaxID=271881 RepID=UPI0030CDE5E7
MKAYRIGYDEDLPVRALVFANTPGKAKDKVLGTDEFDGADWTDLSCKRVKWADNMEGYPQVDLEILELQHGWSWWFEDGGESIDKDTIPLVKKYGGVEKLISAYADSGSGLHYGEDGFYEER